MTDNLNIITDALNASSTSPQMTKEDFVSEIVPKIQEILNRNFPGNKSKQKIRIHKDRISFAAPCCGDSAHDNSKKRGNIILEGKFKNLYKCFNCGTCMSVQKFLRTYGQSLSMDMINYISSGKVDYQSFRSDVSNGAISSIYDDEKIEELSIDREYFRNMLGLKECTEDCYGRRYVIGRHQYNFDKFMYSEKVNKLFILNLTKSGKIFGLQVRSFNKGDAKYKTYGLQKIHEMILKDDVKVDDDINELSMIFNILLVDCNRWVTVTEGPMDSFLIKNSVALCGAGKNIDLPFMVRFMFDDDKAGREHAIEKLEDGYSVFMWERFKKDMGIKVIGKLDFNDVVLWCDKNGLKMPVLDDYYSDDELDLINI